MEEHRKTIRNHLFDGWPTRSLHWKEIWVVFFFNFVTVKLQNYSWSGFRHRIRQHRFLNQCSPFFPLSQFFSPILPPHPFTSHFASYISICFTERCFFPHIFIFALWFTVLLLRGFYTWCFATFCISSFSYLSASSHQISITSKCPVVVVYLHLN